MTGLFAHIEFMPCTTLACPRREPAFYWPRKDLAKPYPHPYTTRFINALNTWLVLKKKS